MESGPGEVTQLLEKVRAGDKQAENRLFEIVMPQLRRLAQAILNRERPHHTLQGTELVNEVYLRLAGAITRMFHGELKGTAELPFH